MRSLYLAWLELALWLLVVIFWFLPGEELVVFWQPVVIWIVILCLFWITKKFNYSPWALPLVGFLVLLGWVFLYRLDPNWAQRQFWGFLVATCAYLIGLFLPLTIIKQSWLLLAASFGLLTITALFGVSAGGAKAWLEIGFISFQPVEISRILLMVYLSQLKEEGVRWRTYLVMASFFALLVWQRDLGPALLVFFVFCVLSLLDRFSWATLATYLSIIPVAFLGAYFFFPHLQRRVSAWLYPWDYWESRGYQILQGLFAIRAGGIFGKSLGSGLATVIPAVHTDYLLAIIGEELGLLSTFALVLVYLALAFWGIHLVKDEISPENGLLGLGMILLLHGQVFLVVGGILRIFPFTGLTLPFVSFGSTSLVAQFWMLGMLTSLGRNRGEI